MITVETDGSGAVKTRYVLDSSGVQVGQQQLSPVNNGFGWYVTDLRNNVTQLLDNTTSAGVKAVYNYDPFGQPKAGLTAEASGWSSRLRYQMAPLEKTTGRYNIGPRLYDPGINRFVGADFYVAAAANMGLALDPLTGNRYMYAGANPATNIDDGHAPCRHLSRASMFEYLTGVACAPPDFYRYMGYWPQLVFLAWGVRFVRADGSCSSPTFWVTHGHGFTTACLTHDYGYDLIRYFRAVGRDVSGDTRAIVDSLLRHDLHSTCANRYRSVWSSRRRANRHGWADKYFIVVRIAGGTVSREPARQRQT